MIAQQSSGLRLAAQLSAQQKQFTKAYANVAASVRSPGSLAMVQGIQAQQASLARSLAVYQQIMRSSAVRAMVQSLEAQQEAFAASLRRLSISKMHVPTTVELLGAGSSAWLKAAALNLSSLSDAAARVSLPVTSTEVMRPLVEFSHFSNDTLNRLSRFAEDSPAFVPLARSLDLAQREIGDIAVMTPAVIGLDIDESLSQAPRRIRRLNLLVVEREELLASTGSGGVLRVDDYGVVSLASRTAGRCRSIQTMIVLCNEAAELTIQKKVFTYTDRVVSGLFELAWIVPRTKLQLGEFVNNLYFALYEGAGAKNLRYMEGGLLSDPECEFIWRLKHLRNKWLFHDIEHGSQGDIRRSRDDLKETLAYFGLSHLPVKPSEYRHLHRAIVEGAEAFLTTLLGRLQGADNSP